MKWVLKAAIMRVCDRLFMGEAVYKRLQKTFGRLNANPMSRLPDQAQFVRWILEHGQAVEGRVFFEIGTGHIPLFPIGFFLAGAASVTTVDLNRRLDFGLLKESLDWIISNKAVVQELYRDLLDLSLFEERFAVIERLRAKPREFLEQARIGYLAPADAGATTIAAGSVDYVISNDVLEHIPPDELRRLLEEARRILRVDGLALHHIDPGDHFQEQDPSITKINFLRFSDEKWTLIAGKGFAYCNRLRLGDYLTLFQDTGFQTLRLETVVNEESLNALRTGFPLDKKFQAYDEKEICTTDIRIMLGIEK